MDHIGIQKPEVPILQWNVDWPSLPSDRPPTLEEFRNFPGDCGFQVSQKYVLDEIAGGRNTRWPSMTYGMFFQKWLFYGLLSTVLRDEYGGLKQFDPRLQGRHKKQYVNTEALTQALLDWETFERQHRRGATLRLMEAESVLEYARQVVRANLAAKGMPKMNGDDGRALDHDKIASSGYKDQIYGVTEQKPGEARYIDNRVSLSIMVLGETLSAQKTKIMDEMRLKIRGWNSEGEEEDAGWGPPKYVLHKMKEEKWCPRTVRVLFGQLGSSATLLLLSLNNHKSSRDHLRHGCDQNVCKVIAGSDDGNGYQHMHAKETCKWLNYKLPCEEVSFDKSALYSILQSVDSLNEEVNFPIFRTTPKTEVGNVKWKLEISSWNKAGRPPFATISHVWSDGLGNKNCNGVHPCQLDFINMLLRKVLQDPRRADDDGPGYWFWLDTLGIPVEDKLDEELGNSLYGDLNPTCNRRARLGIPANNEFKNLKRRAISQIHIVFKKAAQSIVIDRGLCGQDAGKDLADVTMKVLTSNWMRRLWTLQEAYLSRKLFITFHYNPDADSGIWNFDDLMKDLTDENQEEVKLLLSIAQLVRRRVFHNIMGKDRLRRLNEIEQRGSLLVANAWRAVRWRTTSKEEDETLALSTLLQLDYRTSSIRDAGVEPDAPLKRDLMMRDFWKLIDKHYKGSIPPGIIFLPGKKLTCDGFRWAPRTWMSSHDEDHPYPLSIVNRPARLAGDNGLVVQYPGFLLHCRQGEAITTILGLDNSEYHTFDFPVDRELHQWYRVEVADLDEHKSREHRWLLKEIGAEDADDPIQLAVIVSRPNPREMVPEIGLLVQVCNSITVRDEYESRQRSPVEHYCKVIHRVRVARLFDHNDKTRTPSVARASKGADCYGEVLDSEQVWFVDGFKPVERSHLDREASTSSKSTATMVEDEVVVPIDVGDEVALQNNSKWFPQFRNYAAAVGKYTAPAFMLPKEVDAESAQGEKEESSPKGPPKRAQTTPAKGKRDI